jgi:Flp pilus assembly protein TadG
VSNRWWRADGGGITPMVATFILVIFMALGMSVDGSGMLRARHRADDVAAEAARAGGQALDLPRAITGQADVIDPAAARAAALDYLAQAGVHGTVTVPNGGRTITVTVTIAYEPIFLGLIGLGPWNESGTATATLITG